MVAAIIALCICLLVVIVMLGLTTERKDRAQDEYIGGEAAAHAKCVAHIAQYVGNAFAAQVLVVAAQDFDSLDEKGALSMLAREYDPDGPSMPALWMIDRAARLLGERTSATDG